MISMSEFGDIQFFVVKNFIESNLQCLRVFSIAGYAIEGLVSMHTNVILGKSSIKISYNIFPAESLSNFCVFFWCKRCGRSF